MQKNTKILLGLGLIGLAYYLWQKSNKQITATSVIEPPKSSPNVAGKYEVLEDFKSSYTVGGVVGLRSITFTKGEVIGAAPNPYGGKELYTTTKKQIPQFDAIGQIWTIVPKDKVKLIS